MDQLSGRCGLRVLRAGLFDSIQAPATVGRRAFGVPPGGPFDLPAHELANALLGNPPESPALELTGLGGHYEATGPLAIALAGAPMIVNLERADGRRERIVIPQSVPLGPGDRLDCGATARGLRTSLAVLGGWGGASVLTRPLRQGDFVPAQPGRIASRRLRPDGGDFDGPIRILPGPDAPAEPIPWSLLDFRVRADSNRMGLRLAGPRLDHPADPDRLSAPVGPGAIQLAAGCWIVLGPDGGTMGGYPHVAHVISADLARLAQARPGDTIRFTSRTLGEARQLDRDDRGERASRLLLLRAAVADGGFVGVNEFCANH